MQWMLHFEYEYDQELLLLLVYSPFLFLVACFLLSLFYDFTHQLCTLAFGSQSTDQSLCSMSLFHYI